ncbi:MAG: ATP-binding cassette domain-containing protein, partial [Deinococcota bacterium]|nr:ATP-binding cassette domain-containing protein [Deinococcota bacterium]
MKEPRMKEPGILHKIFALLSPKERRHVVLLMFPVVVMAFVQVLGIASITPLLALLANPDVIHSNRWLNWLYTSLNFSSTNSFLIFLGVVALVAIAFSNGFTALTMWALDRFTWRQNHTISKRLLDDYLHRPYVFYLSRNTANLSKNILAEVNQVVTNILVPGMQLIAKAAVTVFILALLVYVDPLLAVAAALVLGGAYLVIYTTVRKKLGRIGKERVEAGRQLFQIAGEAFGGIKDVKILGKEQDFIKQFSAPSLLYSNHMATKHIIGILPKYALETVAFGGILLIILYLLVLERDISQVLPLLGLYAVAIYRLMPALQQIFQSVTKIRFHLAALDVLYKDVHYQPGEAPMRHIDRDNIKPLPFRRKLELRDITFRYPGAKAPVFEDFNLTIDANSSVAFVGATGSGKTTTVDIILGLIRPERGRLLVDDAEIGDGNLANWQKNLGYVPQHIYL